MIVGGQRFPDTAAGYRYAARHVFKLGPTFYDDARGLAGEATRLEQRERMGRWFERACWLLMIGIPTVYALRWLGWTWK